MTDNQKKLLIDALHISGTTFQNRIEMSPFCLFRYVVGTIVAWAMAGNSMPLGEKSNTSSSIYSFEAFNNVTTTATITPLPISLNVTNSDELPFYNSSNLVEADISTQSRNAIQENSPAQRQGLSARLVYQIQMLRKLNAWAMHIKRYIRQINCKSKSLVTSSRATCELVKSRSFDNMVLYMAPPKRNRAYSAILPDGDLQDSEHHHSISVVDPFPEANFGHLVLVFYIDGSTRYWCERNNHEYIGSGLCLINAKKSKCWNHGRTSTSSSSYSHYQTQNCEVNFIPLVVDYFQESSEHGRKQELICMSNLAGFGACPARLNVTSEVDERCELRENTKQCYLKRKRLPVSQRQPLCGRYQICDYAVTIFGGWNAMSMRARNEENIRMIFNMLRKNGFHKDKIQVFYNGNGDLELDEDYNIGLPATEKSAIRHHISTLCTSPLCVDSLVIYLNGPSTSDGKVLLWDKNGDGLTDPEESYTAKEVITDVTGCAANQVVLMVDQSYSGVIASELKYSKKRTNQLDNVVLLVSGDEEEYSWRQSVTSHWSKHSRIRSISWGIDGLSAIDSSPILVNRRLAEQFTLYGAPVVRGLPRFFPNLESLRKSYMGCQNLPTSKWILQFLSDVDSETSE